MKLTTEELKFIDSYLLNSGIEYLDVRLELNDHIASAIENEMKHDNSQTFYQVFKSYMVKNKKSLLLTCKEQESKLQFKVIRTFLKNVVSIEVFVLLMFSVFTSTQLNLMLFKEYFSAISLLQFVLVLGYYFVAFNKLKKVSVAKLLKVLIGLLFYSIFYTQNIFGLLVVFPLLLVAEPTIKWIRKCVKETYFFAVKIAVVMFTVVIIGFFIQWSQQFVTPNLVTFHFLFQFILWYVLLKTLLGYRKELSKKYKLIFETTV